MNSNFSMKEDFDVSFTPSIKKQLQSLEIKGVCEVKHFREGDLLSIDLRKAIDSIGEITGQITNDEMLGNIFSNFCIGK